MVKKSQQKISPQLKKDNKLIKKVEEDEEILNIDEDVEVEEDIDESSDSEDVEDVIDLDENIESDDVSLDKEENILPKSRLHIAQKNIETLKSVEKVDY